NLPDKESLDGFSLSFTAHDRKGVFGHHMEMLRQGDFTSIRVETDKTLYKPGDPITVQVAMNEPNANVILETAANGQTLFARSIRIRHGLAEVVIGTDAKFQDEVTIAAYEFGRAPGRRSSNSHIIGSRTVLIPRDHELKVDVKLLKATYRP